MKKYYLLLTIVGIALTACSMNAGKQLVPDGLQCEYADEPLGINNEAPRFSWRMSDPAFTEGQVQTAYHILMASSKELLNEDKADVWNSGTVNSPQSLLIPFAGKRLASSREYFWKVRVYDKDGKASAWSKPARFVTGLMQANEWEAAQWIRHPQADRTRHIWFRKGIKLDGKPERIFIHLASLGHHELYVNGNKVDDRVLAPALTDLQKRLYYVTYDVSKLLAKGDNTIAVWFSAGWASYNCFNLTPCFRAVIAGNDARGAINIVTDQTWRCTESNSRDVMEIFTYNKNGGEIIDARASNPDWNKASCDDSAWPFAAATDYSTTLEPELIAPSRITETIRAEKITEGDDGIYKIDFGKNFTGWIDLKFHGLKSGDTVTIGSADDDKSFCDFNIRNYFISSGKDGESFRNRFNYVAGRFANLKGLKQKPALDDAVAYAVNTDLKRTGTFKSSNELYNRIFETDIRTFLANTTEGYTSDCPHRERCGYGEVATACSWGLGLPLFDGGAYYNKVTGDWRDVQTEEGWGRHTAPQPHEEHWGGAMWSSAGMNVAWHHYMHYGDKRILETIYPTAKRWLEFLNLHTVDGLVRPYREHNGQFLGDWLAPHSRSEFGGSTEALYFNNCVYAMNLETFVKMADILGNKDDAAFYETRLTSLRSLIHNTFYNAGEASYCTGTQVQNAFALLAGIAPANERERVAATILSDMNQAHQYFDMGSSGLTVLLKYLVDNPKTSATAAGILNKTDFPGYGYFIDKGESTWPEDWKIEVDSKIHTCYTAIAGWFVKSLCGICYDEAAPGYKSFILRPQAVKEADWAEASIESPYGLISSRWERKNGEISVSIIIPPNTSAKYYPPAGNNAATTLGAGKYTFKYAGQ